MDISELMVEALTELKDSEEQTPLDVVFMTHPLMSQNYANLVGQCPSLLAACVITPDATGVMKMLMLMSYRIGIKVGEQQVMDKFMPKEERGE